MRVLEGAPAPVRPRGQGTAGHGCCLLVSADARAAPGRYQAPPAAQRLAQNMPRAQGAAGPGPNPTHSAPHLASFRRCSRLRPKPGCSMSASTSSIRAATPATRGRSRWNTGPRSSAARRAAGVTPRLGRTTTYTCAGAPHVSKLPGRRGLLRSLRLRCACAGPAQTRRLQRRLGQVAVSAHPAAAPGRPGLLPERSPQQAETRAQQQAGGRGAAGTWAGWSAAGGCEGDRGRRRRGAPMACAVNLSRPRPLAVAGKTTTRHADQGRQQVRRL